MLSCPAGTPANRYLDGTKLLVYSAGFTRLFWCLSECYASLPKVAGRLSQFTTVLCVTNCNAVCDSGTSSL